MDRLYKKDELAARDTDVTLDADAAVTCQTFSFFFRNTVTLSEINHTVRRHYVGTVWSKCEVWREKKTKQGVQTESLSKKSFWLFTTCLNGSDESQVIVLHLA